MLSTDVHSALKKVIGEYAVRDLYDCAFSVYHKKELPCIRGKYPGKLVSSPRRILPKILPEKITEEVDKENIIMLEAFTENTRIPITSELIGGFIKNFKQIGEFAADKHKFERDFYILIGNKETYNRIGKEVPMDYVPEKLDDYWAQAGSLTLDAGQVVPMIHTIKTIDDALKEYAERVAKVPEDLKQKFKQQLTKKSVS